ncbi:hypothetical protein DICPUDRAFT_158345 [Dictyostelium purpureum]|uniref:Terpene synthase 5 n=1 Tax=Dictyostelium purpureum TaxID=5786 RepID=TPS5_DICPU|nr:uncharacterized protein DICPUDRAFT_158345 [Dictyostelium purpureum]F1A1D6.1 RecName: Full=Terpene synthase 5 [Dictyostelium purpureum]AXN72974.1 terpene synthase [Dictyostelium purpureum]EGC29993.1 hypothetical protein DICPUDRAFT_158345 [Dictyostelium purpureum]|eukprot:XP_003293477.1 hypothetical protein DICPUDRAFT_158345 [Dictyostelium purpureum]
MQEKPNLLSLKKFYFPKEWSYPVNTISKHIRDTFDEAVECGLFDGSNEKHFAYANGVLNCVTWFYPKYDYEQLMVAAAIMQWIFVLDDFLERDHMTDEKQQYCVRKYEDILIQGRSSPYLSTLDDCCLTPLDKYTLVLRKRLLKPSENRIETFNIFVHYLREWFFSIIPLKKSKGDHHTDSVPYEVYSFIRTINIGLYFVVGVNSVAVDTKVHGSFWINPIWQRMVRHAAKQIIIFNDCVSYAKEINHDCAGENCLYILQKKLNLSFEKVYEHVVEEAKQAIFEIQKDEVLLVETLSYLPEEQMNGVKYLIEQLREIVVGNRDWALMTPRYVHNDSPFIETRGTDPSIVPYEKILNSNLY